MSNVVVPLETDPHQAVQALLPWYSRERLSGEEMSLVREHLQHCAACRTELEAERSLQAALADGREEPSLDTEAALRRMRSLMSAQAPEKARHKWSNWMPWALGLQGVAIAALVFVVARPAPETLAPYQGLSAAGMPAEAVHAETIVMFRASADEAGIRKALLAHRAVMVGGPTESGAYRLHLPGGAPALAALRAEPVVSLAESLDPRPPLPAQP